MQSSPGEIMRIWHLFILAALIGRSSGNSCGFSYPPDHPGYCIRPSACPGAAFADDCNNAATRCCVLEATNSFPLPSTNFSRTHFIQIFGDSRRNSGLYRLFARSLSLSGATTCHQQAAFATQVAFDTNYLQDMAERLDTSLMTEDKARYIGRGAIQIHGKAFYEWLKTEVKTDLTDRFDMLMFPSVAFNVAAEIWKRGYTSQDAVDYNNLADGSLHNLIRISYSLHGNVYNIDERLKAWKRIIGVLGCSCDIPDDRTQCEVDGQLGQCRFAPHCQGRTVQTSNQCEGPSSLFQCCLDCNGPMDVALVFDGRHHSAGTSAASMVAFARHLIGRFSISPDAGRFTVATFSNSSSLNMLSRGVSSRTEVSASIGNMTLDFSNHVQQKLKNIDVQSIHNQVFPLQNTPSQSGRDDYIVKRILLILTVEAKEDSFILKGVDKQRLTQHSTQVTVLNIQEKSNVAMDESSLIWNASNSVADAVNVAEGVCEGVQIMDDKSEKMVTLWKEEKRFFTFDTKYKFICITVLEGDIETAESIPPNMINKLSQNNCIGSQSGKISDGSKDQAVNKTLFIKTLDSGGVLIQLQPNGLYNNRITLVVKGMAIKNTFMIRALESPIRSTIDNNLSAIVFHCSMTSMLICLVVLIIFIVCQCRHACKNNTVHKSRSSSDCDASTTDSLYCSRKISNSSRKGLIEEDPNSLTSYEISMTMVPLFSYFFLLVKGKNLAAFRAYRNHRFWFDIQCSKFLSVLLFLCAYLVAIREDRSQMKCQISQAAAKYFTTTALLWIFIEFWHLHGGLRKKITRFNTKGSAYAVAWGIPLPLVIVMATLSLNNANPQRNCWNNFSSWYDWVFGLVQVLLIIISTTCCCIVLRSKTVFKDCKHPSKLSRYNFKIVSAAIFYAACLALGMAIHLTSLSHHKKFFSVLVISTNVTLVVAVIFIYLILLPEVKEAAAALHNNSKSLQQQTNNNKALMGTDDNNKDNVKDDDTTPTTSGSADSSDRQLKLQLSRHKSLSSGDLPWTTREIVPGEVAYSQIPEHNTAIEPDSQSKENNTVNTEANVDKTNTRPLFRKESVV